MHLLFILNFVWNFTKTFGDILVIR